MKDLNAWKDMASVLRFENIKDEEGLKNLAVGILNKFSKDGAKLFGRYSTPKTEKSSTMYHCVAIFAKKGHLEYVIVKFLLHDGVAHGLMLSHREYGELEDIKEPMKIWINANDKNLNASVKAWNAFPTKAKLDELVAKSAKARTEREKNDKRFSLTFRKKDYIHRHSQGKLHEFTPRGQADLAKWEDMLSIVLLGEAKTEEDVKKLSDGAFNFYKQAGGRLFGMRKQDKTDKASAQYLGSVFFMKKTFSEYVKMKVLVRNEKVYALMYSHRFHLDPVKNQDVIKQWLTDNEERNIHAMWAWNDFPTDQKLAELTAKTTKELNAKKEAAEKAEKK